MTKKICPDARMLVLLVGAISLAASAWAAPPACCPQDSIAASLQPFVDHHVLAGAVTLVADKDKVLSVEAVGYADVAAKKPMQTDCLFWIASQSKPITAAALMILVDEKKVNVDDPIEKYLPEFKGQWLKGEQDKDHVRLIQPKHPITVKNVLTHTSGLPFKSGIEEPTLDLYPLATRVRSYAMLALEFAPDTKYQYSNAGINTAGRIIEVVSGMPYEEFLEKRLLGPLGMKDTTFWPNAGQLARLAKAYKPTADKKGLEETPIGQLKYPLCDRQRQPMPAGGLFSTAADLALFYRMIAHDGTLHGKRILSAEAVHQMTTKQTGSLANAYGFGFNTGGDKIGHGGAYNTNSAWDSKHGLITIFLVQHAAWLPEGQKILPAFLKAAETKFAPPAAEAHLQTAPAAGPSSNVPTVQPSQRQHVTVFKEPGRYGGWPANGGCWSWGNEILVGFTAAWYKPAKFDHAVDRSKPFEPWQARSLDGGLTWSIEKPACFLGQGVVGELKPLADPLDFTHPHFAMVFHYNSQNVGPSHFFTSTDRGRTWRGPYSFAVEGIDNIATRTDYLVLGPRECLMFGSAAKPDHKEGRPFCARTTDGGQHWKLVSLIGPEPAGYAIMPSSLWLADRAILTTIRHADPGKPAVIDAYRSDDGGRQWTLLGPATPNIGGNPPSLVRLHDGRLCLTYGYRLKPFGARARITADEGRTWGPEIVLRDDGLTGDLGYPRSVVRPDGKIVTIYYFNGPQKDEDRTIQATIWMP